jgi:hypothetical protein
MENKRKQFVEKYDKTVGTISDFFFFFKKNYPFFDNNQIVEEISKIINSQLKYLKDREDSTDFFGKE